MNPRLLRAIAVACLCALHVWLAASVSPHVGITADEPIHVTSGRIYWDASDFRFQPENGNLPQRWLALPLLGRALNFPDAGKAPEHWIAGNPWDLGHIWLFKQGNDPDQLIARARMMNALLGGVLCLMVYLWSASLVGASGGFLALGLAVFCPNLLANAGLATSDTATALAFTLALLATWRLCHRITLGRTAAAGLAFGLLAVTKFSALLLGPIALLLIGARLLRKTDLPVQVARLRFRLAGWRKLAGLVLAGGIALGLSIACIWSAYGFRYAASNTYGEISPVTWSYILIENERQGIGLNLAGAHEANDFVPVQPGMIQTMVRHARDARLLPEAWLYGLAYVALNSKVRFAFLAGDYSLTGWPEFFPLAFVLKTPPAVLLLLPLTLVLLVSGPYRRLAYRLAPALVFLVVYWAAAVTSHLNIGFRHLLPTLPVTYVLVSCSVFVLRGKNFLRWAVIACVTAAQAAASFGVRPHYLTYFNTLAGGPSKGYHHLVDSSLDWGQGLPALRDWLKENHRGEALHLSYFGEDEPSRLGFTFTRLGDELFDRAVRDLPAPMNAGLYCLGATMYQRTYSLVRGPWSPRYETAYQNLSTWFLQTDLTQDHTTGEPLDKNTIKRRLIELENLRFGRLCRYLQNREPLALVGNSILIFRLSSQDIIHALSDPVVFNAPAPAASH
ncbi:MAG: hypothetical protein RIQ79_32 [Verrucomicrobiota bacterium]